MDETQVSQNRQKQVVRWARHKLKFLIKIYRFLQLLGLFGNIL